MRFKFEQFTEANGSTRPSETVVAARLFQFSGAGSVEKMPAGIPHEPCNSTTTNTSAPTNIAAECRLPMRWMSDGQEVPRDLKAAAPRLLAAVAALRVAKAEPVEVLA
ncbi:MAG: hypothetical protein LAQ69_23210 [Acidobacteriia bacterium]|nr:hypothetical protein [Terriglobia bacterium]